MARKDVLLGSQSRYQSRRGRLHVGILQAFSQAVLQVAQFDDQTFGVGEASPEVNHFQAALAERGGVGGGAVGGIAVIFCGRRYRSYSAVLLVAALSTGQKFFPVRAGLSSSPAAQPLSHSSR